MRVVDRQCVEAVTGTAQLQLLGMARTLSCLGAYCRNRTMDSPGYDGNSDLQKVKGHWPSVRFSFAGHAEKQDIVESDIRGHVRPSRCYVSLSVHIHCLHALFSRKR